ncbi:hypothetical protein BN8_02470 [Fibrisoma limi BUZ 3]|uniref:Uncharacterized protein n=1 Tax=Fibrisoma limi BUZ 3 TaxID=1185876 RepID=I2GHK3_9BACT|nr:hypothetical protein [Fibrisoma limi]CCH53378.1 hypothetical protein BN8_02470 [Fibrisoma limi BUZ 3]
MKYSFSIAGWLGLALQLPVTQQVPGVRSEHTTQQTSTRTTGLKLSLLQQIPTRNVVASYAGADKGAGNTSVNFESENTYKWSGGSPYTADSWGYFTPDGRELPYIKRDRDLGQTFQYTGKTPKTLTAITVATGYGTNAVRPNTYGAGLSVQVFAVSGEPVLNDNGSGPGTEAFHGFPHNRLADSIPHTRDDYFTGEAYTSLAVFSGATFPGRRAFGFAGPAPADRPYRTDTEVVPPDHPKLKGRLLRFALPADKLITLMPGKQYAFLIMLDKMAPNCGFTLANNYYGKYPDGHGIRRDGNGVFPPVAADPTRPFTDPSNAEAYASAHFPADLAQRTAIPPGTNGYPDVCTWRDLLFYIEAK